MNVSRWGSGIPNYEENDLMTDGDKLMFAMNIIFEHEIRPNGYKVAEAFTEPHNTVNFIVVKGKKVIYIKVAVEVAPRMPVISQQEKDNLLYFCQACCDECYYAPVGIGAADEKRFAASLALKNDEFYVNYQGLQRIDQDQSEQTQLMTSNLALINTGRNGVEYQCIKCGYTDNASELVVPAECKICGAPVRIVKKINAKFDYKVGYYPDSDLSRLLTRVRYKTNVNNNGYYSIKKSESDMQYQRMLAAKQQVLAARQQMPVAGQHIIKTNHNKHNMSFKGNLVFYAIIIGAILIFAVIARLFF